MTDMVDVETTKDVVSEFVGSKTNIAIDETYWGYIIHTKSNAKLHTVVLQTMAFVGGAAFLTATIGLWLVPTQLVGTDILLMRLLATLFFLTLSLALLYFASRGGAVEVQIDNHLGEIREVVRNRAGKSTLLGRYGFDAIGEVVVKPFDDNGDRVTLALKFRNSDDALPVIVGDLARVRALQTRLQGDLMLRDIGRVRPLHVAPLAVRA